MTYCDIIQNLRRYLVSYHDIDIISIYCPDWVSSNSVVWLQTVILHIKCTLFKLLMMSLMLAETIHWERFSPHLQQLYAELFKPFDVIGYLKICSYGKWWYKNHPVLFSICLHSCHLKHVSPSHNNLVCCKCKLMIPNNVK